MQHGMKGKNSSPRWNSWPHWSLAVDLSPWFSTSSRQIEQEEAAAPFPSLENSTLSRSMVSEPLIDPFPLSLTSPRPPLEPLLKDRRSPDRTPPPPRRDYKYWRKGRKIESTVRDGVGSDDMANGISLEEPLFYSRFGRSFLPSSSGTVTVGGLFKKLFSKNYFPENGFKVIDGYTMFHGMPPNKSWTLLDSHQNCILHFWFHRVESNRKITLPGHGSIIKSQAKYVISWFNLSSHAHSSSHSHLSRSLPKKPKTPSSSPLHMILNILAQPFPIPSPVSNELC